MRAVLGFRVGLQYYSYELPFNYSGTKAEILKTTNYPTSAIEIAERSRGNSRICNAPFKKGRHLPKLKEMENRHRDFAI